MEKYISLIALLLVFSIQSVHAAATSSSSSSSTHQGPEHETAPKKPSKKAQLLGLKRLDNSPAGVAHAMTILQKEKKIEILRHIRERKIPIINKRLQLQGVNLDGMRIEFEFWSKILQGADFTGASLVGITIMALNMNHAILKGANLQNAFVRAYLNNADLSNADLSRADLTGVSLKNANLSGADLNRTILTGADLRGANLTGVKNLDKAIGYSPQPEHELAIPSPSPKHQGVASPENEIPNVGG